MWKYHNESPCIAILSKQKVFFFKNKGQKAKTGPVWGVGISGMGEDTRKG
jgi:hypothetical protein